MNGKIKFEFSACIWQHTGEGAWHFVSMPVDLATEIREHLQWQEEGWGRMKATAQIGGTTWETAIWFDKKHMTYILPLKAAVRKKEGLVVDTEIHVLIWI